MWARIINAALGIWLMASSSVLDFGGPAKSNSVICGALAASFAIIAIWETTRGLRHVNLLIGVWLLIAPWIFGFATEVTANSMIAGLLMAALSMIRGNIEGSYNGGWEALFRTKEENNERLLDSTEGRAL